MAISTEPRTPASAGDDRRMRRDIGTIGLLFTGIGSIIASGGSSAR